MFITLTPGNSYITILVVCTSQNISTYVSQVSRVYAGVPEIENEWLIGPIPVDDGAGMELVGAIS